MFDGFYFLRYWAICVAIFSFPGCDVARFKVDLSDQAVFIHDHIKTKISISWERKELLRWNEKHFCVIFKGFSVVKNFSRSDIPPLTLKPIPHIHVIFIVVKISAWHLHAVEWEKKNFVTLKNIKNVWRWRSSFFQNYSNFYCKELEVYFLELRKSNCTWC